METVKKYYIDEIESVSKRINKQKKDFLFAMVADSHLDNALADTLENIKRVDENVKFNCMVHLGDFLTGNIPRKYTKEILKSQMGKFKNAISTGVFYPVQGNHDGFVDQVFNTNDVAINEDWFECTKFVNDYSNVNRKGNAPYFYVDYPDEKIRLIFICSTSYSGFYDGKQYNKKYEIDDEQIDWLREEALNIGKDYTLMLFSHDIPFSNFENIDESAALNTLLEVQEKNGFLIAAWFVGHFHGDYIKKVKGINFVLVASETAYVPQLWDMPEGGYYPERQLNTVTEDLWDACLIDRENKMVNLIRFGAGVDRSISY